MNRNNDRFNVLKYGSSKFNMEDIFISADIYGTVKGSIIDLSANGIGFEFRSISGEQIVFIKSTDTIFLKLFIRDSFLLVGVKLVWSIINNEDGQDILKGGFEIITISPEDNIRFTQLIETIRNSKIK